MQVLRFLRPDVKRLGGEKVVAICLTDASVHYTHPNEKPLNT